MEVFDMIFGGFRTLFTLENLLILLVGVFIGVLAGSIPGLSSSNTTAILLPLTLGMSPSSAMVFIGSIYVGCQYGGSIPAILFKTPGTTGAGATTIDGFPLAQKGKATYALGISLTASCIGGIISAIIALFVIKPSAQIALKFGPAEIFLLSLVGIAVIVTASEKNLAKGLLAGLIGMLIAIMPADPTLGRARLTFGCIELYNTIPLIPALVGLFAFPSMISLVGEKTISREYSNDIGNYRQIFQGMKATMRHFGCVIRSALIGLFVGILPGAGIDVAAFLSYGQAKVFSKHPEEFGKGAVEGVIASEASNNAVCGGALVPSIALGIPGSSTMAIMLAALTLQGINPGPQVMNLYSDDVYSLFVSVLLANILLFPIGLFYTKAVSKLTVTNIAYLIPGIFVISIVGCLATRGFVLDMFLFLIFGVLGYIMTENGYPIVPLILGLVMGSIAEENFVVAFRLSKGSFGIFFQNGIDITLWAIVLLTLVLPSALEKIRANKRKE